mgnify:CR=1 FL=1
MWLSVARIEGKKPVRRSLPEHLEVVVERLEPQEKLCPHCGQERCVIREECSERLDLIPAHLIRRRTIRPVLDCGRCKDGVAQAEELGAALKQAGVKVEYGSFPGTGLQGHAEINRKLGEPDYPATPVMDAWLKGVFGG